MDLNPNKECPFHSPKAMREARAKFKGFLSEKGLRATPQRALILDAFLKSTRHLRTEELYNLVKRRDPSVGQATVYRALRLLAESGIAREVDFGDGVVRYEHDHGHEHHVHLICERCRKSIEVLDPRIEKLQEKLAREHGFTITSHKLDSFGICPECRAKEEKKQ